MTCNPPGCAKIEVKVLDSAGSVVANIPPLGVGVGWERVVNRPPLGVVSFDLQQVGDCCPFEMQVDCFTVQFCRDGSPFACFNVTDTAFNEDSGRFEWYLEGFSGLLYSRPWVEGGDISGELSELFVAGVRAGGVFDSVGVSVQPTPTDIELTINRDPTPTVMIGETLDRLVDAGLDWVEYYHPGYGPVILVGNIDYDTGRKVTGSDWTASAPVPAQSVSLLASAVAVKDSSGRVGVFPSDSQNGLQRGSGCRFRVDVIEIDDERPAAELEAIARARWRRKQRAGYLQTPTGSTLGPTWPVCIDEYLPGALLRAELDDTCGVTTSDTIRTVRVFGQAEGGQESDIGADFVAVAN